ncbi:MAG: hypothetical protein AAF217_06105 [Pseudomonadota bacterium]
MSTTFALYPDCTIRLPQGCSTATVTNQSGSEAGDYWVIWRGNGKVVDTTEPTQSTLQPLQSGEVDISSSYYVSLSNTGTTVLSVEY